MTSSPNPKVMVAAVVAVLGVFLLVVGTVLLLRNWIDLDEIRSDGYVFQIEMTYRAVAAGCTRHGLRCRAPKGGLVWRRRRGRPQWTDVGVRWAHP